MAKCGIKQYDELPSRVNFIDVDMTRWALSKRLQQEKESPTLLNKIIWFFTSPLISKERCIQNLETARRERLEDLQ